MAKQGLLWIIGLMLCTTAAKGQLVNRTLVKFNISGAVFKNYMAQYERIISKNSSITFSAGVSLNAPLPFKQALMNRFSDNADAVRAINTTLFTKYVGTLEYRFYLAGHAPTGWYLAPFVRYLNMTIDQDYTYTDLKGVLHRPNLKAQFNAGGAGVLLGYQWMLGKRIGLDLWLLGPFYGTNVKADFVGNDPLWQQLTAKDIQNIRRDINSVELPGYTVTDKINLPTIEALLEGPYYGVRAFGLALSYRF
ncbi:MAG: DUF3575 domain-containing protein [Bacteroidetes bacterium]|nr:DUF3575 domain-containing protein [Bacteroidota bacterium]